MLGRPHRLSGPYVVEKTLIGNFALQCLELMVSTAYLVGGRSSVFDNSVKSTWVADLKVQKTKMSSLHDLLTKIDLDLPIKLSSLPCSRTISKSCTQANCPKAY